MGENRPTGDTPPDESTDQPRATRRLTVREAAVEIGVSEAAVRNRISRGTLRVEREDGAVYVLLESGESAADCGEPGDQPDNEPQSAADESRLIDALEDQVEYLRGQLDAEREAHAETREARRRADHIIAALTERIPELEAPPQSAQEAQDAAESVSKGESREEAAEPRVEPEHGASQPSERRSWWRRIFGG